jgi:DNA-binding NtrC family response regulator
MERPPTLLETERAAIVEALRYTTGNIGGAAWVLDIGQNTLRRKIVAYEIRPEEWMTKANAVGV